MNIYKYIFIIYLKHIIYLVRHCLWNKSKISKKKFFFNYLARVPIIRIHWCFPDTKEILENFRFFVSLKNRHLVHNCALRCNIFNKTDNIDYVSYLTLSKSPEMHSSRRFLSGHRPLPKKVVLSSIRASHKPK